MFQLGLPTFSLLGAIEAQGIDLLVLYSHGRIGFTRWVLGSVARVLLHQSSISTLRRTKSECEEVSIEQTK